MNRQARHCSLCLFGIGVIDNKGHDWKLWSSWKLFWTAGISAKPHKCLICSTMYWTSQLVCWLHKSKSTTTRYLSRLPHSVPCIPFSLLTQLIHDGRSYKDSNSSINSYLSILPFVYIPSRIENAWLASSAAADHATAALYQHIFHYDQQ